MSSNVNLPQRPTKDPADNAVELPRADRTATRITNGIESIMPTLGPTGHGLFGQDANTVVYPIGASGSTGEVVA